MYRISILFTALFALFFGSNDWATNPSPCEDASTPLSLFHRQDTPQRVNWITIESEVAEWEESNASETKHSFSGNILLNSNQTQEEQVEIIDLLYSSRKHLPNTSLIILYERFLI